MLRNSLSDTITNNITYLSALCFVFFVIALISSLVWNSSESIKKFGSFFLTKSTWNTKFLELSKVHLNQDNSLILSFSVPLKDQNFTDLITLQYTDQLLNFSYINTNMTLIVKTPDLINNGIYKITISSNLIDRNNNKLNQNIEWSGDIVIEKKQILSSQIIDITTQKIKNLISDENYRNFTILPFIIGTVLSSLIALFIAFPVAIAIALLLTEYTSLNSPFLKLFSILIDLLAGIPSIIYGLWGLFFLVPRFGANLFTASLVLSIMIMPYAAPLSREAFSLVPTKLKQAGLGLGASKYKVITKIILPHARSGIIAGILLTLGRALGETLAVTMVIGNRNQIPTSIFDPTQTIASLIANEYGESSGLKQSSLIQAGLILIMITLLFSLLGRIIIRYTNQNKNQ